ncbi:Transcriptional regulator containing an amidase domain and an AraC-type DNA-binding HTH domain (plasmid) [Acidisarcina polymorpha]|uniref:Transcriptional regulator containing an amidase domain and an AraC-type DNA-binding HTH domain n=1 Tax=Acidisarcina polymorpha TaxID=2211140 RepID=A0A2Z5GBM0_9BACT|nr:GlxA family transcriptional regulator [Acidisarcina polymorpha]AXC16322.1 Transcriptional regulator containing an amidase domain and an AraC-type DNA-binding HTH domain [Acidisarcina polymorpha]AXC16350.1 Transcriptional regulator containing an amidase domain and an AraC-type DNA-binding HTH domain [Acidisarcina polymorpha]
MAKEIGFLLYPGYLLLDLAGPMSAFALAERYSQQMPYRMRMVSVPGGPISNSFGLSVETSSLNRKRFDTLIVVGGARWLLKPSDSAAIRSASSKTRRTASVCTGAFVLAQCGLLDGLRVTTHWRRAAELQREHGAVRVESDAIFIKDGRVWTSAGVTAGIDLALAMIEEDYGAAIALEVSRELVVYYRRPGGQSQFSTMSEIAPETDRIRIALSYAREHLTQSLSLERLAEVAHLSPRQFGRLFKAETGETPAKAVERLRAEVARNRVENDTEPVESIASAVGFYDPERMRRTFVRLYGEPPQSLRRKARRGS